MIRLALITFLVTSACDGGNGGGTADGGPPDGAAPDGAMPDGAMPDGPMPDGSMARLCMPSPTNAQCVAAEMMQTVTLGWIEQNVFSPNCGSSSCHGVPAGGGNPGGRIVLTADSHGKLVGVNATYGPGRKLVVASDLPKSYLMVMLRAITLAEAEPAPAPVPVGNHYMPLGSPPICCQKLDAIGRWIMAGAQDN